MIKIAVTSGKGGVGKTSIALNLGAALAAAGKRVIVLDGDLGLANIDILAGITPDHTLQQVVTGQMHIQDIVCQTPYGVGVVSGGSAISALMHAGPKRLALFFGQIDELSADTDFMIIDTSAGLDTRVMGFLGYCDHVAVVATPEPTSITDAYALIKVHTRKHPEARIHVVVNQVQTSEEGISVFLALRQVCEVFINQDIEYLGEIRKSPIVSYAIRNRQPFVLSHPKDTACMDVSTLAIKVEKLVNSKTLKYQNEVQSNSDLVEKAA
jgi:flagellar biosynthesis protein FlhG